MSHIGVIGAGQLGRMLALAGLPLGHQFSFYDPNPLSPARSVGALTVGAFDDVERLLSFVDDCDVVTYEFENVPVSVAEALTERSIVLPNPSALRFSQHRATEKQFLQANGIETAPFVYPVPTVEVLLEAVHQLGGTAILKTCTLGYDGKGQRVIRNEEDAHAAWKDMGEAELILEGVVPFDREVSLIAVRAANGSCYSFPLTENVHRDGILRRSTAHLPSAGYALQQAAAANVHGLMDALHYVGVLTVEFFVVGNRLIANEIAPRVHNSGHWTIDGCYTSQFEAHIRAITGLPLHPIKQHTAATMINIVGSLPDPQEVLNFSGTHLHLYDKAPRRGRKLGHVTICMDDDYERDAVAAQLEACVPWVV